MRNFKKMLSVILLCLLLLPIILSCGSESPPDESNTTETSIYEITSETDTPVYNIEAVDYKGIEFNFLCRDALFQTPEMHDLFSEGNNGEILNDTIYLRNSIVEEKYNVHINTNIVAHTELINRASNSIMAGDKDFDVVLSAPGQNFTLATRGYIVPFNDLPVVDIENEWWMRSFMEDSSIHGKNYVAVGDMNIGAMNAVGVTFFNKKLTNSLGIEDPYELVKNGDWTFDVLIELTAGISSDLNGDSIMDELDRYGMITNVATWYGLFYGAGGMIIEKNAGGDPIINFESARNVEILQKIQKYFNDRENTLLQNHYPNFVSNNEYGLQIGSFIFDRAIFSLEFLYQSQRFRVMDSDFGILPCPKYDENQDDYISVIHQGNSFSIAIPIINTELDMTGRLLEEMTYQSHLHIKHAYFETMLNGKVVRDQESIEMLEIIYSNIKMDIALLYNLGFDNMVRSYLTNNVNNLISLYESESEKLNQNLNTAISVLVGDN